MIPRGRGALCSSSSTCRELETILFVTKRGLLSRTNLSFWSVFVSLVRRWCCCLLMVIRWHLMEMTCNPILAIEFIDMLGVFLLSNFRRIVVESYLNSKRSADRLIMIAQSFNHSHTQWLSNVTGITSYPRHRPSGMSAEPCDRMLSFQIQRLCLIQWFCVYSFCSMLESQIGQTRNTHIPYGTLCSTINPLE